jgi:hypothetical protein
MHKYFFFYFIIFSYNKMASNSTLNANTVNTEKLCIDGSLQLSYTTISAPAEAEAVTASTITTASPLVVVSTTNNANDRIYLPSPTDVPMGFTLQLIEATKTGYELGSKGDGTTATTINTVAVTNGAGAHANELAIARNQLVTAVKTGANAWTVTPGAADAD